MKECNSDEIYNRMTMCFSHPYIIVSLDEYDAVKPLFDMVEKMTRVCVVQMSDDIQTSYDKLCKYKKDCESLNWKTSENVITSFKNELKKKVDDYKTEFDKLYRNLYTLLDEYESQIKDKRETNRPIDFEKNVIINIEQYHLMLEPRKNIMVYIDYIKSLMKKQADLLVNY